MNIYFNDKSNILGFTFIMSIPIYFFVSILVSFLKIQTDKLKKLIEEIKQNYLDMEDALISALEAKDVYIQGHSERVHKLVSLIVSKMKLKSEEAEDIITAARLHDIGKIGINDSVLNKPGRLTEEEYAQIMDHPVMGSEIVKKVRSMYNISNIIRHHHEKYDGSGYPDGLKGEEIPLGSRIIAVADAFDAMTSKRSYRDPFLISEAIEELRKNTNIQFDAGVVDAFISALSDVGIDY
ncbi:HD-GYP domain-containing protein [Thermoanaerobacterium sp. RBIITD]|uniref:HD-GYP domain-containing protein n=1 Tax=Thermoanaerobacterium sp. RBIITD TaxID=1550240 RepID=UPI001560762E|nr:HD-GYP domain-containing protein [Thermoanaerobacterium sp. RBIITD]